MLGKRRRPMIRKISELLVPSSHVGFVELATSPRSPLDLKIQSPRGMKSYDLGGVGLAIVAALEKPEVVRGEILAKCAMFGQRSNRSYPIPVNNNSAKMNNIGKFRVAYEEPEVDSLEDYTKCHRPGKSFTRVYCDKGEEFVRYDGRNSDKRCKKLSIFSMSPTRSGQDVSDFPMTDILSSCNLCKKKLHGKDIYMYRGEKGFCSEECRHRQIIRDERKQFCRPEASTTSADYYSNYSYTRDQNQMFQPSILAI